MPSAISPIPIAPGDTFSRWTILARAKSPDGHAQWLCRCVCGVERGVQARKLREGKSTGCGRSCPSYVDPRIRSERAKASSVFWTPDEDAILLRMRRSGADWHRISRAIPTRSWKGCKLRCTMLGRTGQDARRGVTVVQPGEASAGFRERTMPVPERTSAWGRCTATDPDTGDRCTTPATARQPVCAGCQERRVWQRGERAMRRGVRV